MKSKDFLAELIGDTARARLLRIFIFNDAESFTLVLAAKRAGITPRIASRALRELEHIAAITRGKELPMPVLQNGKLVKKNSTKKTEPVWTVNTDFEHFRALSTFVHEVSPARYDTITTALKHIGRLGVVVLSGNFMGDPTRPADLLLAADGLSKQRLETALKIGRAHV